MKEKNKIEIEIPETQCESCSMALRRFIGKLDGVVSIDTDQGKITIHFDGDKISEDKLLQISKDSLEKLGHAL